MKLLLLLPKVIDDVKSDLWKFISTSIIKRLLDSIEMIWLTPLNEKTFLCVFFYNYYMLLIFLETK